MQGNPGQSWILHSTSCTPDSRCWIPVFVIETWILYSRLKWYFRFLLSCSCIPGSQTLGFWIPSATIYPVFRIPDSLALRRRSDRFWYWVVTQFWPCYSEWPGMNILFFSVGSLFESMLLFTTNFLCKKVALIQQSPKWPFILMQKEMNNLLV